MTDPTLYALAESLMAMAKTALAAASLAAPARQVIYIGQIPADCEQLAVVFDGWTPTPPQEGMVVCQSYRWGASFTILVTRSCVPGINNAKQLPKPENMSATAEIASNDAEALLDLVANVGEHDGGSVAVSITPPQGGLQSTILEITVPVTRGLAWQTT